jgi:hypothetical protein
MSVARFSEHESKSDSGSVLDDFGTLTKNSLNRARKTEDCAVQLIIRRLMEITDRFFLANAMTGQTSVRMYDSQYKEIAKNYNVILTTLYGYSRGTNNSDNTYKILSSCILNIVRALLAMPEEVTQALQQRSAQAPAQTENDNAYTRQQQYNALYSNVQPQNAQQPPSYNTQSHNTNMQSQPNAPYSNQQYYTLQPNVTFDVPQQYAGAQFKPTVDAISREKEQQLENDRSVDQQLTAAERNARLRERVRRMRAENAKAEAERIEREKAVQKKGTADSDDDYCYFDAKG